MVKRKSTFRKKLFKGVRGGARKRTFHRTARIQMRHLAPPLRRRIVHPELKYVQTESGWADLPIAGAATPFFRCTAVVQGDGGTNRDGQRIWMRGGHFHMEFRSDSAVLDGDIVRILIVKQLGQGVGGVDASLPQLLVNPDEIRSFHLIGSTRQYKTLVDKTFIFPSTWTSSTGTLVYKFVNKNISVPMYGPVIYALGNTDGTDVMGGEVTMFLYSQSAARIQVKWSYRMRFTDS